MVFAPAITVSIFDSVSENARWKGCEPSVIYAKNTSCCQNATSRSTSSSRPFCAMEAITAELTRAQLKH